MSFWAPYLLGVATIPGLIVLGALGYLLARRDGDRAAKCDHCDWRFAGLAENFDRDDISLISAHRRKRPMRAHAAVSEYWHNAVVNRTRKHRAAWTAFMESPEGAPWRAMEAPYASRLGTKGHQHQPKEDFPC
ncbi:hypothetical protein [Leucobacter sp. cx-169]|uniref:hypothetical protein n=1 Tax=Leucobacter sp. cx-169 TaxID=2770549 RepID=UPI00165D3390|nr:hypothetical protein [Leucobacter sp. cx-169]MBC9927258.1 hypothetical protein [Leucobacter sp. cx-169]